MTRALVIGKFYPPHLGHVGLLERASREADEVVGIVMASITESIPLHDRVEWLSASLAHLDSVRVIGVPDDAPVDYESEIAWVAHSEMMRVALRHHGVESVDVVVSSEPYGAELAKRLGARHVSHDPSRNAVSVSGTAVRDDPVGMWHLLPEPTRLGLAVRVIVLGAESTGTTTLSRALADHFSSTGYPGIEAVEEYGREFTYVLHERARAEARALGTKDPSVEDLVWLSEHFAEIALEQTRRENSAALASPLVIADTDALATTVWERRYVGASSRASAFALETLARRDLYIVTDHVGVPFEQDGWRDGEHIRADMTRWMIDAVHETGLPWMLVRGSHQERLDYSITAIETILESRLKFT
ncbi:HTH-type transcriptional repressor of NAD biosynthesis genes [Microbacteriaceae bacterium SG_E_30_P1]|uniref:HTH-type transcriptional repressor of NAD biosynthesis genes n=1 Tax=Antiquaquibacter oligotrophicus TaxID=2880260 RepID=A0ABT6KTC1_9MICO|nr:AAA family ATPase [Antiquaquibacter oligotrophicus]MDH6182447.1 HTH-type transcriptional repressor of NAD biosynthesis genes [Antiquaquibacter oligotrophicus]UDF14582.1 AAA family ATPase [Antiquaquibacter oligotrophicus]